jgi:hypothetical protein
MDKTLEYLLREYKERMALLTDAVARGNCRDIEEYRFTCGQLRGLESACAVLTDLVTKLETLDE